MFKDLIICLLVIPFESLQKSEHKSAIIIVTFGQSQVFDLKEVSEVVHVCFFALSQIEPLEQKALIVT